MHPYLLTQLKKYYGIQRWQLRPLAKRESGNLIFAVQEQGHDRQVLKAIYSTHGAREHLQAAQQWCDFLGHRGIACPRSIPSRRGRIVETIQTGASSFFHCIMMSLVPGKGVDAETRTHSDFFRKLGTLTGKMHALSRDFQLEHPDVAMSFRQWDEDPFVNNLSASVQDDTELIAAWNELKSEISELPKPPEGYGIVHSDLQPHNVLLQEDGTLGFVDSESVLWHWFSADYVAALEGVIGGLLPSPATTDLRKRFSTAYWQGYQQHHTLPEWLLAKEEPFWRLWCFLLYNEFTQTWDMGNLSAKRRAYLAWGRENVLSKF